MADFPGARLQSRSSRMISPAISSGAAGRPGKAYPSPNHFARSRSLHRLEQKGVNSSVRGRLQMGQGLEDLLMTRLLAHLALLAQGRDRFLRAIHDPCACAIHLAIRV